MPPRMSWSGESRLESRWMEPPKGRGSDGGRGSGRAVEVDAAQPLRGEEGPGVVGGSVGVVEGDAVEVDVVVAVGKAAEVGLGLAEADAVAVGGEGAGGHLDGFAVVGDWRHEVCDHGLGDLGARGGLRQQRVHRGECGGDGVGFAGLDGDLLGDVAQRERDGNVGGLAGGDLHAVRLLVVKPGASTWMV